MNEMEKQTRDLPGTGRYYAILNYGCQMNASDAEHYAGQLEELGYAPAADYNAADVVVMNTCCVRDSAEKRILGKIGEMKRVKAARPDMVLVVAGCMAQSHGDQLQRKYPQIDLLLGTSYVDSLKDVLTAFLEDRCPQALMNLAVQSSEFEGTRVRQSGFAAWIPIMYGCNNFCSYCIVPYVRGRERSRSQENILAEVRAAVAQGYTEITLLGQNVDSYGNDLGQRDAFAALLRAVDQVPGVRRVHYMTNHPKDLSDAVIAAVAEGTHICEDFHLPVQSGSNRILKAMNRRYTREEYLTLVEKIRARVPNCTITTDIIVGFPGETDAEFEETLDLVRQVGYDAAFTFIYSKRTGTPAAKMPDQVPQAVKHERLNRLMEAQNANGLAVNQRYVGRTLEVLVEGPTEKNPKVWNGRTRTNKLVLWPVAGEACKPGEYVNVKICSAQTWLLKGELCK